MAKKKKITPPTAEDELLLDSVVENGKDAVLFGGRERKIGWMRNGTLRKVTRVLLREKDERKVTAKCAAALILNGLWKIKFLYPFLWRWYYYVRQYGEAEYQPLFLLCKKKVEAESYYINTILLTGMKDTVMAMTREEASRIRQGLTTERAGT